MEQDQDRYKRRRTIIIIASVLLVLAIVVITAATLSKNGDASARVVLNYNINTIHSEVEVRINDTKVTPQHDELMVTPGPKQLTLQQAGYKKFSSSFTARAGQTIVINANLLPEPTSTATPTVHDASQLTFPGITNIELVKVQYFESNQWAVATVNTSEGSNRVAVLRFEPLAKSWDTVLGPGDIFQQQDVDRLPQSLQAALINNTEKGDAE